MKSTLTSDKVSVRGPNVDGGWKVTLDVGSFEMEEVAKLLLIPSEVKIKVEINWNE